MSHVVIYRSQYYRVEIGEITHADQPERPSYVCWCSQPYLDLKETPNQTCSQFVVGSEQPSHAAALERALVWIRDAWATQQVPPLAPFAERLSVVYTVWLFKGNEPSGVDFEEFSSARAFAEAAQKGIGIIKIGIKNNESPQFLSVWEKGKSSAE